MYKRKTLNKEEVKHLFKKPKCEHNTSEYIELLTELKIFKLLKEIQALLDKKTDLLNQIQDKENEFKTITGKDLRKYLEDHK